jgi:hypothetical protein
MRRLMFVGLLIAPMLTLGGASASAFGCGYGYGYGYGGSGCCAPRAYGYSSYRPAFYGGVYRPRLGYRSFYRARFYRGGYRARGFGLRGGRRW